MQNKLWRGTDQEIHTLCDVATGALEAEDRSLRDAMGRGYNVHAGHSKVAHGLSYWLFENTLVYLMFRSWLPIARVAWEHTVGANDLRPKAFLEGRRGASEKCDLMLLDGQDQPRAAFEAKWWNTRAGGSGLIADANKLRRTCPTIDKYLLAFWWSFNGGTAPDDIRSADSFCADEGLRLDYVATFSTQLLGQQQPDGVFALGLISVPQS